MGVEMVGVKYFMNFFDEFFVEEFVCICDKKCVFGGVEDICVIFVGFVKVVDVLCIVMVMGVDWVIYVEFKDG